MKVRKWTESQSQAIKARNGTILVSAAAGSGKTAVLVERVLSLITDENNPVDIDRLLIVTFTRAAANEMKERISNSLSKLIDEDPFNKYLRKQQILLSKAKISTIHSFCSELIRSNFQKLNISPGFRVADSNEMEILRSEALDYIIDTLYEENSNDFLVLSRSFSKGRDDKILLESVEKVYDFVRAYPFMEEWFENKLELFKISNPKEIEDNPFSRIIISYTKEILEFCIDTTNYALEEISIDENIMNAYNEAICFDLDLLINVRRVVLKNDWDEIRDVICSIRKSMLKLKALRGYKDDPLKKLIINSRDEVKKSIELLEKLFSCSSMEFYDDMNKLYPIVNQLFETVKRFSNRLDELKMEKKILDFSDLEQLTLKLLIEKTEEGFKKTNDAIRISGEFYEIMVDEYQDTNEVQDMIFRALSKNENNLFMVGDTKQSIYRFRQAMPEIFLKKMMSYKFYNENSYEEKSKINLDKNFRSTREVIDAVNFVFSLLMSTEIGELEYTEEEKLKYGATYYNESITGDVSLKILDISEKPDADMDIAEATYIANVISEMIGSVYKVFDNGIIRPVTYRDFCILLRSTKNHSIMFSKQLNLMGIPTWSEREGNFFKTVEISVMISLLKVIDNPIQDIPLVSVLMSPIYGFSPDDMSKIRMENKNEPLYFSIKKTAECDNNLAKKCRNFLKHMILFTRLSASLSSDKLINIIYEETKYVIFVQAMNNGNLRLANLRMLLDYARTYENSGYKGLSSFIRFIDKLQDRKSDLTPASLISENANVVKVMSMHASKGLEFPICIIANCSRKFNRRKDNIILNSKLSLGLNLKDDNFSREYDTIVKEAINIENEKEQLSEELRILYVAMTRARQKLIMVTSLKSMDKIKRLSLNVHGNKKLTPYVIRKAQSFSDWILTCILKNGKGLNLSYIEEEDISSKNLYNNAIDVEIVKKECFNEDKTDDSSIEDIINLPRCALYEESNLNEKELRKVINERLDFNYPFQELESIPSKITASEILSKDFENEYAVMAQPSFMCNTGLTRAQKGEALHKFLAQADLCNARKDIDSEIEKLLSQGKLSIKQAESIRKESIKKFFNSKIYKMIINSEKVFREYKFSVELKLKDLYNSVNDKLANEVIILQGAVDCVLINKDEIIIIDYKTDKFYNKKELMNKYKKQLDLYSMALNQCFEANVKKRFIYSFYTNNEIMI